MNRSGPGKKAAPPMETAFQRCVYLLVSKIPRGRVASYAEIARAMPHGSARAVGQALKRNPFAPRVPCHRVIASDGTPGGFQGRRGGAALKRKLMLLAREGVIFRAGKMADPARFFTVRNRKNSLFIRE